MWVLEIKPKSSGKSVIIFLGGVEGGLFISQDQSSLCGLRDQAGLELRDLPASAFRALGLKVCATTAWL